MQASAILADREHQDPAEVQKNMYKDFNDDSPQDANHSNRVELNATRVANMANLLPRTLDNARGPVRRTWREILFFRKLMTDFLRWGSGSGVFATLGREITGKSRGRTLNTGSKRPINPSLAGGLKYLSLDCDRASL